MRDCSSYSPRLRLNVKMTSCVCYGLQQASRMCNEIIDSHIKNVGFKAASDDPSVHTRGVGDNDASASMPC